MTEESRRWGGRGSTAKGVLLVAVSAFFASTAGLFSKGIAADAWSIIFWRGVFVILSSLLWLAMTGRLRNEARRFRGSALAVAVLYAAATGAFIPAFKLTSGANVVLIMTIYRRFPETPAALPIVGASLLLLPVCWVLGDPASASAGQIALTALFGLTYVVASITLAGGSACLAPGETALVSVSETPWAILLVGLVLAEWPSTHIAIGGTVIMAAVLWYQVTALRRGA